MAVTGGNIDVVRALVAKGISATQQNNDRRTALDYATSIRDTSKSDAMVAALTRHYSVSHAPNRK